MKQEWIDERTIIMCETGSRAYGTNTPESDHDYKGVCIPPVDFYLGLETFNEYNNTGGKNWKNTKDDIDISISHINKFVRGCMQGVPNDLEILFANPESYQKITPIGQMLIDNRHLFLSKQIKKKFCGYANAQIHRMNNGLKNGGGRQELVEQHGYDTKMFAHAVRLLLNATRIFKTGDFSTYLPEEDRKLVLKCRNGQYNHEEAMELFESLDIAMQKEYENTTIPDKPDYNTINDLLIKINKKGLHLTELPVMTLDMLSSKPVDVEKLKELSQIHKGKIDR